ncbi:MAG: hypothetical protein QOI57_102 [Rubrobacteraceae bacterium]|nr:hypothetical protein [Rubrobacteraceae bacterium]
MKLSALLEKKRILLVVCTFVLSSFLLAGCGSDGGGTTAETTGGETTSDKTTGGETTGGKTTSGEITSGETASGGTASNETITEVGQEERGTEEQMGVQNEERVEGMPSTITLTPVQAQTSPDISITQTASPTPIIVGQPLTFTITATNNSVPQHVGLKGFLSPGLDLVSVTPSQGTCGMGHAGSNGVECGFGDLPTGGSATVEIVATPTVPGTMTNTMISGGEFSPESPETATITVNPAPEASTG